MRYNRVIAEIFRTWHSLIYWTFELTVLLYTHQHDHARIINNTEGKAVQAILHPWRGGAAISKAEGETQRIERRESKAASVSLHRCSRDAMWIVSLDEQSRVLLTPSSPRRTIATAQTLYMRFHLFFPYRDFNYTVSLEGSFTSLY